MTKLMLVIVVYQPRFLPSQSSPTIFKNSQHWFTNWRRFYTSCTTPTGIATKLRLETRKRNKIRLGIENSYLASVDANYRERITKKSLNSWKPAPSTASKKWRYQIYYFSSLFLPVDATHAKLPCASKATADTVSWPWLFFGATDTGVPA